MCDPSDLNTGVNWKRTRELCGQQEIEFKNQTFVQFIKQLRDKFIQEQSDRHKITESNRKQIIKKCNNQCAICKCSKSENKFEVDHIKPLSAGGTNHIDNLQLLCKACHKQKCKHEQEDGEYVRIIETESSYNDQVKKIMQDPMSYSYAFIESLNSAINKKQKNYHIDINKC